MKDFTLKKYKLLLQILQRQGFSFQTFEQFIEYPKEKVVILRHDVDRLPNNALQMARLENSLGFCGSYYFRIVKESFHSEIIKEIVKLGHEIGYHYENLSIANSQIKNSKFKIKNCEEELFKVAIEDFAKNLKIFRKFYPVKTICMHGSPLSKWDSKKLWQKFDYRDYGIIAEPYFDVDFSNMAYLTDTGRRWNGDKFSFRDRVTSTYNFDFNTTQEIIKNVASLPDKVMFTIHPERWNDAFFPWLKAYLWQNLKNVVKYILLKRKLASNETN
jgi:hypothetical protein